MADQLMRGVTVQLVRGARGPRWLVSNTEGTSVLSTAGCGTSDWLLVEQHVRAAMGQQTPAERYVAQLFATVEQYGVDHPVGAAAQAALIEGGHD